MPIGTNGDDTLFGTSGDDTIDGQGGNDFLDGGPGNDSLQGGLGYDTLEGGPGNDTLNGGGSGDDGALASFQPATGGVHVNLATGVAADGLGGTDTLINIQDVWASNFADLLFGDANDNWFYPGGGNDSIDGAGGNDVVSLFDASSGVTVNLANGTVSGGGLGNDSLTSIERAQGSSFADTLTGSSGANELIGGNGNDSLAGGAGNDELFGENGDDSLEGGAGNDFIDGGAGNDFAFFSGSASQYAIDDNGATGYLVISGPDGTDTLVGIEHLVFAVGEQEVQQGSDQADTLGGTSGDDVVQGNGGNDSITGDSGNDALYGNEGDDSINAGSGNDLLDGGIGNDTMLGGSGNDTYIVDSAGDVVAEEVLIVPTMEGVRAQAVGGGIDRVIASVDYTLANFVENLQLASGTAALAGSGNTLGNIITGNDGRNVLTGLAGNDSIDGGGGIDTAAYSQSRSDYTVNRTDTGWQAGSIAEGTDTLANVERLQFSDRHLALDLDGNAGSVAKVLGAVFGAAYVGNAQFVSIGLSFADGGMTYEGLMSLALGYVLGSNVGNSKSVVDLLWANVIGTPIDADTEQNFMGYIDGGGYTAATLGLLAADTSYNLANIGFTGLQQHGIEYV